MSEILPIVEKPIEQASPVFTFNGQPLIRGRQKKPLKLFIYGRNGIGKTTFACQFEKPVLLDLENNATHMEVDRFFLSAYRDVQTFLYELKIQPHDFKTVILDSVDVLEDLITQGILTRKNVKTLNKVGGYGEGYKEQEAAFDNILTRMNSLFEERDMNVIFIGHETLSTIQEPGEPVYDRITPAIREVNYSQICNWCFGVFYATSEIDYKSEEDLGFTKKRRTVLRKTPRVFYTTPSLAYLAKNIFDLSNPLEINHTLFMQEVERFYHQPISKKENE